MTDWGQVAIAAIVAVPATIAAVGTWKNATASKQQADQIMSNTNDKFSKANGASIDRNDDILRKIAKNTDITTEAKDQAGAAFEVSAQGMTVANGMNLKFLGLYADLAEIHAQIKRHRDAQRESERRLQAALDKLDARDAAAALETARQNQPLNAS